MRRQWKPGMHWHWNVDERRKERAHQRAVRWIDAMCEENNKRFRVTTEEEKRRVFKALHDPDRPLRQIADNYEG